MFFSNQFELNGTFVTMAVLWYLKDTILDNVFYVWDLAWLWLRPQYVKKFRLRCTDSRFRGLLKYLASSNPDVVYYDHSNPYGGFDSDIDMEVANLDTSEPEKVISPGEYLLQYRGKYIYVNYSMDTKSRWRNSSESITIEALTSDNQFFDHLMNDVKKYSPEIEKAYIFTAQGGDDPYWQQLNNPLPPRLLETVYIPRNVEAELRNDIEDFRKSKQLYQKMGWPYRRTYLISSVPGMGKTSIVNALCTEYGMHVQILTLNGSKITDAGLIELAQYARKNSVILIEDIDCITHDRIASSDNNGSSSSSEDESSSSSDDDENDENVKDNDTDNNESNQQNNDESKKKRKSGGSRKGVSLSGVLNMLDGIGSPTGVITIMTTNHPERLDHAIIREERVNLHIHLEPGDMDCYRRMCDAYFDDPDLTSKFIDLVQAQTIKPTMAQLQGYFRRYFRDPAKILENTDQLIKTRYQTIQSCITTKSKK